MRLVKQTAYGECACACLAMILGHALDRVVGDVLKAIGPEALAKGMTITEVVSHLRRHGVSGVRTVKSWDGIRPAVLAVPSLNHAGVHHAIVWDGSRFLDPGEGPRLYPDDADPVPVHVGAVVWEEVRS